MTKLENDKETQGKKPFYKKLLSPHIMFLLLIVLIVLFTLNRFNNWGVKIDLEDFFKDKEIEYADDTLDQILPLTDSDGQIVKQPDKPTIVFMGNSPFADDRDDPDNLVNMIARETGSTVYNLSVSGSYLAALHPGYRIDPGAYPMDCFNFYWMVQMICPFDFSYDIEPAKEVMGDQFPPEGQEVYDLMKTIDFNEVDVLAIMYDASDYYAGHEMFRDEEPTYIRAFAGNLTAGIELLQKSYPNMRIIVMSPTYAYAIDRDGNYISSDQFTYGGQDVLSSYVIKECYYALSKGVTFVDNLYGTITEDNAGEYLSDHVHLNLNGRKKVAQRFLYALNYFRD